MVLCRKLMKRAWSSPKLGWAGLGCGVKAVCVFMRVQGSVLCRLFPFGVAE